MQGKRTKEIAGAAKSGKNKKRPGFESSDFREGIHILQLIKINHWEGYQKMEKKKKLGAKMARGL